MYESFPLTKEDKKSLTPEFLENLRKTNPVEYLRDFKRVFAMEGDQYFEDVLDACKKNGEPIPREVLEPIYTLHLNQLLEDISAGKPGNPSDAYFIKVIREHLNS